MNKWDSFSLSLMVVNFSIHSLIQTSFKISFHFYNCYDEEEYMNGKDIMI